MSKLAEAYTPGHTANAVDFMSRRRAGTHAAFMTALLRPGMSLIDCGCGPGTITLDLARLVAPGRVVGIDAEGGQFAEAAARSAQEGLDVQFATGSICRLDFPDAAFDAAFSHALFEHLRDPLAAARELGRVVRPGGFVALRSPDWGGFLLYPHPPEVAEAIALYRRLQTENGGDVEAGRKLPALMRAAGLAPVRPSATYEIYDDPRRIAFYLAERLDRVESADAARGADALRQWSEHPDALFAQAWVEAVGWKM